MITANNGILIVALIFGWGLHSNDSRLMALALVSAVASWVSNFASEWFRVSPSAPVRALSAASAVAAVLSILLALATLPSTM